MIFLPLLAFVCNFLFSFTGRIQTEASFIRIISSSMLIVVLVAILNLVAVFFYDSSHIFLFDWFKIGHLKFSFELQNNLYSAGFAVSFILISAVVGFFSKTYLHQEDGFYEFYYVFLVFSSFTLLTVFSANFDTLFVGWEIVGICSVLLISYYRGRSGPVSGSIFALGSYRIGELFFLIALTMTHFLSEDSGFAGFAEFEPASQWLILLLILATYVKSAQWPFSSWLPRSMEGPTPSSAIFYGGISTHFGPLFLIKIGPYIEVYDWVSPFLLLMAAISLLFASGVGRTRNDVKTQLSYATIAQISIIYAEIAIGWYQLATLHSILHCFFRTFQYLKSPSVLHDHNQLQIERQGFHLEKIYPEKMRLYLYYICHSKFFLDNAVEKFVVIPFFGMCRYIEKVEKILSGETFDTKPVDNQELKVEKESYASVD